MLSGNNDCGSAFFKAEEPPKLGELGGPSDSRWLFI